MGSEWQVSSVGGVAAASGGGGGTTKGRWAWADRLGMTDEKIEAEMRRVVGATRGDA